MYIWPHFTKLRKILSVDLMKCFGFGTNCLCFKTTNTKINKVVRKFAKQLWVLEASKIVILCIMLKGSKRGKRWMNIKKKRFHRSIYLFQNPINLIRDEWLIQKIWLLIDYVLVAYYIINKLSFNPYVVYKFPLCFYMHFFFCKWKACLHTIITKVHT